MLNMKILISTVTIVVGILLIPLVVSLLLISVISSLILYTIIAGGIVILSKIFPKEIKSFMLGFNSVK